MSHGTARLCGGVIPHACKWIGDMHRDPCTSMGPETIMPSVSHGMVILWRAPCGGLKRQDCKTPLKPH
jgi:hypothetical protein